PDSESPRAPGHRRVGTARRFRDRDPRDLGGTRVIGRLPGVGPDPRGGGAAVAPVPRPLAVLPASADAPHPSAPARLRGLGRALRDRDQSPAGRAAGRGPCREGAPREPPTLPVLVRGRHPVRTELLLPGVVSVWIPDLHPRRPRSEEHTLNSSHVSISY